MARKVNNDVENTENVDESQEQKPIRGRKTSKERRSVLQGLMDMLSISSRGIAREDDIDTMNNKFNSIVQTKLSKITGADDSLSNSFLGKLYENENDGRRANMSDVVEHMQLNSIGSNPQDFFNENYRNRMMKQAMAEELSKQLIELRHARNIVADAINSADTTSGTVMRRIVFTNTTLAEAEKDYLPVIEVMEKKFKTLDKIHDYITPGLLTFGEYYVYTIPYYHLFNDFIRKYKSNASQTDGSIRARGLYFEAEEGVEDAKPIKIHTLFEESVEETKPVTTVSKYKSEYDLPKKEKFFLEEELNIVSNILDLEGDSLDRAKKDLTTLFTERITVSTDEIPIPIMEDGGFDMYKEFAKDFIMEDGTYCEDKEAPKELKTGSYFERKYGAGIDEGAYIQQDTKKDDLLTEADIKDCYVKLVPPTRMLPVKMMSRILMYINVVTTPATPLATMLSYSTQVKTKDPNNKMDMLLDDIASKVVQKFDKAYIKDNLDFKQQIVAALEYYDLSTTNIHFQAVPVDYVTAYKINVDVDGNGHSMLEDSLFYGNIYMSLFMFKLLTIFQNSNDRVVHYVRRSGIDKNLWNDVQDIIRRRNARKITPQDIYSHTALLNKVGNGSEEFIGMTKQGDKPIESEIVSGQSVELDTPLMERTRSNYILSTEVPSAIMNYLNEADFAKSVETANTKLNSKISSLQLNCNEGHTDWYKKLLKFATNVPKEIIDTIQFVLPEPKGHNNIAQQDLINNYQTLETFILKLFAGENADGVSDARKRKFLLSVAKMYLNGLNFEKLEELWTDSAIIDSEEKIKNPNDDEEMTL